MELLNVTGTPWKDLGTQYSGETTSKQIVEKANISYTVSAHPMGTDITDHVGGYYSINRDDDNRLLGVINNLFPDIIQPDRSFEVLEPLLQNKSISVVTCDEAFRGQQIFGVFKVNCSYKIEENLGEVYLVAINNHLKTDGKVTIIYCLVDPETELVYSYINPSSVSKLRMPVFEDIAANASIAKEIFDNCSVVADWANSRIQKMRKQKLTQENLDSILDELFPFVGVEDGDEDSLYSKANERVRDQRDTFFECISKVNYNDDPLSVYVVYLAFLEYSQHFFRSADKGYDLVHRMSLIPGFNPTADPEAQKADKFLKMSKKFPLEKQRNAPANK